MGPVRAVLAGLLLTVCPATAGLRAQQPLAFANEHVELSVHPGAVPRAEAEAIAAASWAVIEQALEQIGAFQQLPDELVHVDLYCDEDPFDAVRPLAQLGYEVEQFALRDQRRAHVLLWPELSDEVRAAVGLTDESRAALVRQVAWLCAAQTGVGRDDAWLCQVFAEGVLDAIDNKKLGFGVDARFDARRDGYRRRLLAGEEITLAEWVDWVGVPEDRGLWQASREMAGWCAHLLAAKSRSWPKKLLKRPKKLDGSNSVVKVRRAVLTAVLGRRWDKIEQRLQKLMKDAEPGWLAGAPVVARRGERWLLAGREGESARLCRIGTLPKGPFVLQAKVQLLEVAGELWRFYFFDGSRTYGVFVESDRMHVQTWDGDSWTMLDSCRFGDDRYGFVDVRLEVRDKVKVIVDGEQLLEVETKGYELHAEAGIMVDDAAVLVEGLRVEALK